MPINSQYVFMPEKTYLTCDQTHAMRHQQWNGADIAVFHAFAEHSCLGATMVLLRKEQRRGYHPCQGATREVGRWQGGRHGVVAFCAIFERECGGNNVMCSPHLAMGILSLNTDQGREQIWFQTHPKTRGFLAQFL